VKSGVRLCMAQINLTVGDFEGNRHKVLDGLSHARKGRADLVLFPELTLPGYPPEDLLFKKHFIAENLRVFRSLLPHTAGLAALIGFVDRDKRGCLYNTAALVVNKKIAGVYHKIHLPNYGVFDEKRYFSPGARSPVLQFKDARVGLTICEDIWQSDSFVYSPECRGAFSLLLNISASPYHRDKQRQREALLRRLALRNRCAVAYQNLVGGQDELVFDGGSLCMDARGRVLGRARSFSEDFLLVDVPLTPPTRPLRTAGVLQSVDWPSTLRRPGRKQALNKLKASPALSGEAEVYEALVMGTRDYLAKNGFKKAVIGVSGGIDSALVACIAADAIGAENVLAATLPSPYTSKDTLDDAKLLAKNLGVACLEIPIHSIFSSFRNALKPVFKALPENIAEENLQARIRGTLLMALSNKLGHLVLATGNKSEMATGYCTLYGDMAGGFAVIKDVPKTLVFKLAKYRNSRDAKAPIPITTLKRAPSAELRLNQTDQDTLPAYSVLDRFLEDYVEKEASLENIVRGGMEKKLATRMARRVDLNEYKRRQAPPGIKITPRAFGRDRRMPLTNRYSP